MTFSQIAAAILLSLLFATDSNAETIYKWTDERGVIHLTNKLPPEEVTIQKIISYKERTAKEIQEDQHLQEKKLQERLEEQKKLNAEESKIRAGKVRIKAENTIAIAEEAMKKAQEYMEKKAPRKRQKRNAYRKKLRKIIQEAKKAVALANGEISKANQAEKEAIKAAEEAKALESQD